MSKKERCPASCRKGCVANFCHKFLECFLLVVTETPICNWGTLTYWLGDPSETLSRRTWGFHNKAGFRCELGRAGRYAQRKEGGGGPHGSTNTVQPLDCVNKVPFNLFALLSVCSWCFAWRGATRWHHACHEKKTPILTAAMGRTATYHLTAVRDVGKRRRQRRPWTRHRRKVITTF